MTEKLLISVVSESLPHLKRGAIRDFFNILGESQNQNPNYNMSEHVYTVPGKGAIEFFGADEVGKVRGPRRDILFLNEGNNIPWDAARGLDIRTNVFTFVDWNPVSEFWVYEYMSGDKMVPGWMTEPTSKYIHSTYLDAIAVIPQSVVDNIESNRSKDPNWWNVYGLGKLGKVEGLVYPVFTIINELPECNEEFYGLDFGYTLDITALIRNRIREDNLYSQQLIYEKGLTNDMIALKFDELGLVRHHDEIFADAAEPKSIDEIAAYGFNIKACPKGPGSVKYGHQKVRQYKQFWDIGSTNCIKEQRNYRYIPDKNGVLTEKTTHAFSHGMDGRRYGLVGYLDREPEEEIVVYDAIQEMEEFDTDLADLL